MLTPSKHLAMIGATDDSASAAPIINSFSPFVLFSSISCNLLNTCNDLCFHWRKNGEKKIGDKENVRKNQHLHPAMHFRNAVAVIYWFFVVDWRTRFLHRPTVDSLSSCSDVASRPQLDSNSNPHRHVDNFLKLSPIPDTLFHSSVSPGLTHPLATSDFESDLILRLKLSFVPPANFWTIVLWHWILGFVVIRLQLPVGRLDRRSLSGHFWRIDTMWTWKTEKKHSELFTTNCRSDERLFHLWMSLKM